MLDFFRKSVTRRSARDVVVRALSRLLLFARRESIFTLGHLDLCFGSFEVSRVDSFLLAVKSRLSTLRKVERMFLGVGDAEYMYSFFLFVSSGHFESLGTFGVLWFAFD